ncbi:MAG: hypothetical protein NTY65_03605 [Planctomycetota bacterium]|nr:hypothetical protein [Planctomycetota bacterium]
MLRIHALVVLGSLMLAAAPAQPSLLAEPAGDYAVVVSKRTLDDPQWNKVVKALVEKHRAELVVYSGDVDESLEPLRKIFPRYAAFVAQPEEAGRTFIVKVHRLTRKLDDDPYTDVLWGVITGYSADNALRIVTTTEPLVVRKAAAGTSIDLNLFDEGVWYSEGSRNKHFEKKRGGRPEEKTGPEDAAKPLVDVFHDLKPDLFLTSGHATDRDWQIGYPPNERGQFRCKDGVLMGVDRSGRQYPIQSPNPKVYLPAGNCLMGLIRDKQSIALAWMGSAGVDQMIGYVVSTWYGRGGWGTRDYLFAEPGRYTLSEAFYFNNQTIVHELQTRFPKTAAVEFNQWNIDRDPSLMGRLAASLGYNKEDPGLKDNLGLLWDRDTVAFYGDPVWEARLASRNLPFSQKLTVTGNTYTFQIDATDDCSPGRPPAMLLPHRVKDIRVLEGQKFSPLVTDNFIMVMNAGKFEKGKSYKVVFEANRVKKEYRVQGSGTLEGGMPSQRAALG